MTDIRWHFDAIALVEIPGVSGEILPRAAEDVAQRARELAPVRTGHLKESVFWELGRDGYGPYADVAALWYGRFMDPKARQLKRIRPFLPSALQVLQGRTYR